MPAKNPRMHFYLRDICRITLRGGEIAAIASLIFLQGANAASVDIVLPKPVEEKVYGLRPELFIRGELDARTPHQVRALITRHRLNERAATVYLDSPGGNLLAGIELGKLIRNAGMHTSVGARQSDAKAVGGIGPGVCLSACVYAYVGGYYRYARKDDVIGVHRFFREGATPKDVELAQVVSAAITNHLNAMGVDTKLFEIASATAADNITKIPLSDAMRLRVVNNGQLPATWELVSREGVVYLRGGQTTHWGMGKLLFICQKRQVQVTAIYGVGDVDKLTYSGRYSFRVDDDFIDVTLATPVEALNTSAVSTNFWLTPEITMRMLRAEKLGFAFYSANPDLFYGFQIDAEKGRAKITEYLAFCRTQA